jgi:hypothetical protein
VERDRRGERAQRRFGVGGHDRDLDAVARIGGEKLDEAELAADRVDALGAWPYIAELRERDGEGTRAIELRARELGGNLVERGAQRVAGPSLDLVDVRDRVRDRAVLLEEAGDAFRPESRDTGQAIVGITDESEPLVDLVGADAEPLHDHLGRVTRVLVRVVPPRAIADELRQPLVHAHRDHVVARIERGLRVRRDDIELALGLHGLDPERVEHVRQLRALLGERRRELRIGADHGDGTCGLLERDRAEQATHDGEQRVVRPVDGHGVVAARQRVGCGHDQRAVRHRASAG